MILYGTAYRTALQKPDSQESKSRQDFVYHGQSDLEQ